MNLELTRERLEHFQTPIYFVALVLGFVLAMLVPGTEALESAINPALGVMLFVTFLQVPLSRIRDSLGSLRFMGALLVANFIVIPMLVALALPLFPGDPLIRIAMLFVLLCPCIDYVVTFSHLGKSDSSLLLAATPVLLIVQMLLLPVYLNLLLGAESSSLVEPGPFLHAFVILIVIPMVLAATLQALSPKFSAMATLTRIGGSSARACHGTGPADCPRCGDAPAELGHERGPGRTTVLSGLCDHRAHLGVGRGTRIQAASDRRPGSGLFGSNP